MAISEEIRKLLGNRALSGQMPNAPSLPAAPPTGLIGSEQALRQGLGGAAGIFEQAALMGRQDINQASRAALGQLGGTQAQVGDLFGQGQDILGRTGQQVGGQIARGQQFLTEAGTRVGQEIGQGVGTLQPFVDPGVSANQQQAALSGALGPEAQAQAFAAFQESPEQAFLREQGQRAVLGGASATGGLGGGNVLRELSRFGTGLAAQDLQNRFGRLGAVTGTGLQAAGQVGQLRGQQAGITSALGQAQGQLQGQQAGISGSLGQAGAQLAGQQAGLTSALGQFGAGLQETRGQNLANIATGAGQQIGGAVLGTGQQLAGGRSLAGQQLASAIGGTSANLADLISQQGTGVSGLLGQTGGNVANLLAGASEAQAAGDIQLATMLANLAVGQGTTVAGLPGVPGVQETQGVLGKVAQAAAGVGSALGAI